MQNNLEFCNMLILISVSLLPTVFISIPRDANRKSPIVAMFLYIATAIFLQARAAVGRGQKHLASVV